MDSLFNVANKRLSVSLLCFLLFLYFLSESYGQTSPLNDMFSDRSIITDVSTVIKGSNEGASRELLEKKVIGNGGRSVWWSWTPPTDGCYRIDTAGSSFDTILAVFTGNTLGALSLVVFNDDVSAIDGSSCVVFNATAGQQYQILVDTYNWFPVGDGIITGDVVLHINSTLPTPQIIVQPTAQTVLPGTKVSLSATLGGFGPFSVQWFKDGQPIIGATNLTYSGSPRVTNAVFTISNTYITNSGIYSLVVSNALYSATSSNALVKVTPLFITQFPQNSTMASGAIIAAGYPLTITVAPTCSDPASLSYRWAKDGAIIDGQTNSTLIITNAQISDAGVYGVTVTGARMSVSSNVFFNVIAPYTFSTFAGTMGKGGKNDGPAAIAKFSAPQGLVFDKEGNLYVSCYTDVRKISKDGIVSTLAGGSVGTNDGVGSQAKFNSIEGMAVNSSGTLFVCDNFNHTIRKITQDGSVSTFAGTPGKSGFADGYRGNALFSQPSGIAIDSKGNLFVVEWGNNLIRKITPYGMVMTLCGRLSGNADGPGEKASFYGPCGIAIDKSDFIFVTDQQNGRIRKVSPQGVVTTLADSFIVGGGSGGTYPYGGALDGKGNYYFMGMMDFALHRVTPEGLGTVLAGTRFSSGAQDGTGPIAAFSGKWNGVTVDNAGNIYIADCLNNVIRKGVPFAMSSIPTDQVVLVGASTKLNAQAMNGTYTYQWFCNGVPIQGQTNVNLTIGSVDYRNSGLYSVTVDNGNGNSINLNSNVRVLYPPQVQASRTLDGLIHLAISMPYTNLLSDVTQIEVQWRTNLPSGDDTNWQTLKAKATLLNGTVTMDDPNAIDSVTRFYRSIAH